SRAAENCEKCETPGKCDAWVATHEEGEGHAPPGFCKNEMLLSSFKTAKGPGKSSD
ncbi:DUF6455 family protein, partial [Acinetobacter baumannii]